MSISVTLYNLSKFAKKQKKEKVFRVTKTQTIDIEKRMTLQDSILFSYEQFGIDLIPLLIAPDSIKESPLQFEYDSYTDTVLSAIKDTSELLYDMVSFILQDTDNVAYVEYGSDSVLTNKVIYGEYMDTTLDYIEYEVLPFPADHITHSILSSVERYGVSGNQPKSLYKTDFYKPNNELLGAVNNEYRVSDFIIDLQSTYNALIVEGNENEDGRYISNKDLALSIKEFISITVGLDNFDDIIGILWY